MFKRLRSAFKKDRKLKVAFRVVRNDMQAIEEEHFALKHSTDEWVKFLVEQNNELTQRVADLERTLISSRADNDEQELSLLREI